jgi:hypothetical protein
VHDLVESGESEVPYQTGRLRQIIIIGDDGASFEGIEKFGGVKAEDLGASESTNHFPAGGATEGMGGVEEQLQAVPGSEGLQGLDGASLPPEMDA